MDITTILLNVYIGKPTTAFVKNVASVVYGKNNWLQTFQ
jgi:hypothetical protein